MKLTTIEIYVHFISKLQGPQSTKGQGRMRPSSGRAASTHSVPAKRHGHPHSGKKLSNN